MTFIDANALIVLLEEGDTDSDQFFWAGGDGQLMVSGDFDGATVSLEWANKEGDTPIALDDSVSFTAAGTVVFTLAPGWISAHVVNAGGTTALDVLVKRIPA